MRQEILSSCWWGMKIELKKKNCNVVCVRFNVCVNRKIGMVVGSFIFNSSNCKNSLELFFFPRSLLVPFTINQLTSIIQVLVDAARRKGVYLLLIWFTTVRLNPKNPQTFTFGPCIIYEESKPSFVLVLLSLFLSFVWMYECMNVNKTIQRVFGAGKSFVHQNINVTNNLALFQKLNKVFVTFRPNFCSFSIAFIQ